ncbi:MAG: flagellar export chaperone FlgN [Pseudomonadota bacterium]
MAGLSKQQLEGLMERLIMLTTQLQEALIGEREALKADDAERLRSAVEEKQRTLRAMHDAGANLSLERLQRQLAALPEADRAKAESRHKLLEQLARTAKDYNAVNGKIVQRSQQSIKGLLTVLTSSGEALTYSDRGAAERQSGGGSFTKA